LAPAILDKYKVVRQEILAKAYAAAFHANYSFIIETTVMFIHFFLLCMGDLSTAKAEQANRGIPYYHFILL
jgi:hypothetical protein